MRHLPLKASFAAMAACLASTPALAQTTINSATATPLSTSTSGDIAITSTGSIAPTSGTAITVNSSNSVNNAGNITLSPSGTGATGINILGGTTSSITNSGQIIVVESYVRPDANSPIALATNRFGIHLGTGGSILGSITNSGTIAVEGQNSAGIGLDSALNGSLNSSGTILALGENSYGIRTAAVTGDVTISGTGLIAIGKGAIGLAVQGNVGGAVSIQGPVQQVMTFTNDNGVKETLLIGDIRVGAPAAWIAGSVGGGISITSAGSAVSLGNGPALLIGGTGNSVIGAVAGSANGNSLVIAGTVSANSMFNTLNAYGLVIGGQGGAVSMAGGISVTGAVRAAGTDSGATAIQINAGSNVPSLVNSGSIATSMVTLGHGTDYAIQDLSGTLTNVQNLGSIVAVGGTGDIHRAIDLSANTSGVTIRQDLSTVTGAAEPFITGDIVTGSGNDVVALSTGAVVGSATFNAGNDQLLLSGDSSFGGNVNFGTGTAILGLAGTSRLTGTVDFGGGSGTFTIGDTAIFSGAIANGGAVAMAVNGGTFAATATGDIPLNSLTVASGGTLSAFINTTTHTSSHIVANSANFASGAKIGATISSLVNAAGTYNILTATSLTGTLTFDSSALGLPFIYNGSVAASGNSLLLTINRKSAAELGLNRAGTAAYNAIIASASTDANLSASLLGVADAASLTPQIAQLLPDHSGGVFDAGTRASRLAVEHLQDADSFYTISSYGGWLEPIYWRSGQTGTDVASYSDNGWGATLGVEKITSLGRVGLSYSYLNGSVSDNGGSGKVKLTQHEFGLFWRVSKGPLYVFARASAAPISVSSTRTFNGTDSTGTAMTDTSNGSWKGWLFSGTGGLSIDANVGSRFTLRPKGVIDYYRMQENNYAETGVTKAMNLTVASRKSDVIAATTTLMAIFRLAQPRRESRPWTLTLEGGRRSILSGALGDTVANFTAGTPFVITPEKLKSAWVGEVGMFAGGLDYTFKFAGRAERVGDKMSYSGRISFSGAF